MKAPIRIAVIGLGKIARDQHLPSLAADPRFDLVATVDPVGTLDGLPAFSEMAALIDANPALDAVAICTPPQVRGAIALTCIEAGWHVLLEKPPTATLAGLANLSRCAKAKGTTLFAAWHSREAPMVAHARNFLKGRKLSHGRIVWREDARHWHPGQDWLWAPGGLGVFDPGINAFSILTALLPDAPIVEAAMLEVPEGAHTAIAARIDLRLGSAPIHVDLDFRETGRHIWTIVLHTECGHRLLLEDGGARLTIDGEAVPSAPDRAYPRLYERFAELIAAGESDADAAPLQVMADALLRAEVHVASPFID